jgi:hypothetical protein
LICVKKLLCKVAGMRSKQHGGASQLGSQPAGQPASWAASQLGSQPDGQPA